MQHIPHFVVLIKIISNRLDAEITHHVADLGLTSSQISVLGYLNQNAVRTVHQKDIETALRLRHPTVAGILKRLEQKGMVVCETDPDDRRFKRVHMTEKSRALMAEIMEHVNRVASRLVDGLSPGDLETLTTLLLKMKQNIAD